MTPRRGFIEATDWIVWQLTGRECRQSCAAGYKAMWSPSEGLPPIAYFEAAYPGFSAPGEKLGAGFVALGTRAGHRPPAAGRAARAGRQRRGRGRQRRFVRLGSGGRRGAAGRS